MRTPRLNADTLCTASVDDSPVSIHTPLGFENVMKRIGKIQLTGDLSTANWLNTSVIWFAKHTCLGLAKA